MCKHFHKRVNNLGHRQQSNKAASIRRASCIISTVSAYGSPPSTVAITVPLYSAKSVAACSHRSLFACPGLFVCLAHQFAWLTSPSLYPSPSVTLQSDPLPLATTLVRSSPPSTQPHQPHSTSSQSARIMIASVTSIQDYYNQQSSSLYARPRHDEYATARAPPIQTKDQPPGTPA